MNKTISIKTFLVLLCMASASCQPTLKSGSDGNETIATPTPPESDPVQPPGLPPPQDSNPGDTHPDLPVGAPTVCYLSWCSETIEINKIKDPAGDYVYPSPFDFPNERYRPLYKAPQRIFDLAQIEGRTKIAPNFSISEFMSPAKGRYGLYSSHVVTQLQLMRNHIGRALVVNSAFRSPGYNSRTSGSAKWSRHTYGDAVDFYIPGAPIESLTELCEKFGASFTLTYVAHIHCDWRRSNRDAGFFGPTEVILPDFLPGQKPADLIAKASSIEVIPLNDKVFKVIANIRSIEIDSEEGPLTYLWQVVSPDGITSEFKTETLQLTRTHGTYKIKLTVGGSIHLESIVTW